ncbi:MAG: D-alanine--D-alanine ligase [Eggerthellaceae bacterium]|nr:D-alanine--D-alanine ligase [Eggerthellaceae bacterium]
MNRHKVLILFGGCSDEHDVSVKSAKEVAANINQELYEPIFVGITKEGAWKLCDEPRPGWEERGPAVALSPDRRTRGLLIAGRREPVICKVDVVFPVMHGKMGEDGSIQGLLQLAGIPYVGCGMSASMICMDKALTYEVASRAGIAVPKHIVLSGGHTPDLTGLSFPLFVKPARSGSSFGVSKVDHPDMLRDAVHAARQFDEKVVIEEQVRGTEVGCAVLGNGPSAITGELDQIQLSHGFFRIHQEVAPEKGSENANIIVPAQIGEAARRRVREAALRTFQCLGCEGLARVDLFLQDDGSVVLNEVNTMPGLTSYSRYPRMMRASGMPLADVIDRLIELALEQGAR